MRQAHQLWKGAGDLDQTWTGQNDGSISGLVQGRAKAPQLGALIRFPNAPGQVGIETHLNTVSVGRREAVAPELPANHQSHFTAEFPIGITSWWEGGVYLQTALLAATSRRYPTACVPFEPWSRFMSTTNRSSRPPPRWAV